MNQIKLSLIIPIYNVEDYIAGLLKSLLPQLTKQVECIFINDGTEDNSFKVLKKCLTEYPHSNFQLLEQENQGLSMARNNGMKLVNGEYFGFIDSDDEIEPNYIEEILNIINHNQFDIMHFNAKKFVENKNYDIILATQAGLHTLTPEYKMSIFKDWYACFRIFNKKFIDILYFPENKTYEDALAIPQCYSYAEQIYELPLNIYKYICRSTSISNSNKYLSKNYDSWVYGIEFYRKQIQHPEYVDLYRFMIYSARDISIKFGFLFYISFVKKYKNDLKNISLLIKNSQIKDRFFLRHPYFFYFYNKQKYFFNLKWIKKLCVL